MLVAFSTFQGDVHRLIEQLAWCVQLGPQKNHDAVIVADCSTDFDKVCEARALAAKVFKSTSIITNREPTKGWIEGSKSLFTAAARFAERLSVSFLFMETDAIPLKPSWVDAIAEEYAKCSQPFMGHIYDCHQIGLPARLMSGIGVYPGYVLMFYRDSGAAWDVELADVIVPKAHDTRLIFHLWGEKDRAPQFFEKNVPGTEIMCLDNLPKGAVIFHRNKDGTLIHQLTRRMFPEVKTAKSMDVVFPVCNRDIQLAVKHAKWLRVLAAGRKWDHRAVISFDQSVDMTALRQFMEHLRAVFSDVLQFTYPIPPIVGWPAAPNWAFQNTAHFMREHGVPWLWLEADAVVLRADWLDQLQTEYERAGRPFMGPHVQGMSHSNGVMIYPPSTPSLVPSAMRCVERAWDYECAHEMMPQCHNASHLLAHIWTIVGEEASEVGGGVEPAAVTVDRARRWIKPGAVVVHRIKDGSLVDLLLRKEVSF